MTLTVLLSFATVVVAVVVAMYAARACRGRFDVARSLGAHGADIHQIARRTGLQQDVVRMLLAGPPSARQKLPVPAGRTGRRKPSHLVPGPAMGSPTFP